MDAIGTKVFAPVGVFESSLMGRLRRVGMVRQYGTIIRGPDQLGRCMVRIHGDGTRIGDEQHIGSALVVYAHPDEMDPA